MCDEVFKIIKDTDGKTKRKGFPSGCKDCLSTLEWDCWHVEEDGTEYICDWRENHWKYQEIKEFVVLWKIKKGGFDLNRLESLGFDEFMKLSIITDYLDIK